MKKSVESKVNWNHKLLVLVGVMLSVAFMAVLPLKTPAQGVRTIRAVSTTATAGGTVQISFVLESPTGGEATATFSVVYPAVLSNPQVALGSGVPGGTSLTQNLSQIANRRIGIVIGTGDAYPQGTSQILTITFNVSAGAAPGNYDITFTNTPVDMEVVSAVGGNTLQTTFTPGIVVIGPTAAGVEISGRVLTPDGRGLRNARVSITDANGARRMATTSSFGHYRFDDVEAGVSYVIGVTSKQYRFTSRVLQVTDSLTDFDFVGQE